MIYSIPEIHEPFDQGDLLDDCPVISVIEHVASRVDQTKVNVDLHRAIILTQTCDLANAKSKMVLVASVFAAQEMIDMGVVKTADVKGPIRAGRSYGVYFLPAYAQAALGEMIVDFRSIHSVRIDILELLRLANKRRARLLTPYREHLAKHFADTFSRIGLPQPYETI